MSAPHSIEAERSLVGRLLLDPRKIPIISARLAPEDFYGGAYRKMYREMVRLAEEGVTVDAVTLGESMGEEIDVLEITAGKHGPVEGYADIIKRRARERAVLRVTDRIALAAQEGDENLMILVQQGMSELAQGAEAGNLISVHHAMDGYLDLLGQRQRKEIIHMTWGIPGMDDMVNPATGGKFILIAARPSVGKTAMAETIVDHWASLGRGPVFFASLEMDRNELFDRASARHSGVSAKSIIRGTMTEEEYARVQVAADHIRKMPIELLDQGGTTTTQLRSAVAQATMRNEGKPPIAIVVDYLQIMGDNHDSSVTRVTNISRNLKALAREFRVPVLCMSQFNRQAATGTPELHDLRDSGALEQDADVVIALEGDRGSGMRTVHVLKQRQGETGQFKVWFDGKTVTWHSPQSRIPSWATPKDVEPTIEGLLAGVDSLAGQFPNGVVAEDDLEW